eukprot:TRINITY_DN23816_c0_g1_i1.p1 TRINITY_DN23816_c0_g1~~TRINITY_DN23816_c0_g1_i1.p1  ORF type:complete len:280 (-),score=32.77 TRINITY_DN23816_c0_g1_i1:123-962(-)
MKMFAFRLVCLLFCCWDWVSSSKIKTSLQMTCNQTFVETDEVVSLWTLLGRRCYGGGGFNELDLSTLPECLAPHTDNTPHIYVVGDSHSFVLAYGLGRSTSMPTHKFSCSGNTASNIVRCTAPIVKRLTESVGAGDIISLAMEFDEKPEEYVNAYKSFMQELKTVAQAKGARLVLLADWASMLSPPQMCKLTGDFGKCEVSYTQSTQRQSPMKTAFTNELEGIAGVDRIELLPALCESDHCHANVPGTKTLAYSDIDHLSKAGSEYVGYYLCQQLQKLQ